MVILVRTESLAEISGGVLKLSGKTIPIVTRSSIFSDRRFRSFCLGPINFLIRTFPGITGDNLESLVEISSAVLKFFTGKTNM